MNILLEDNHCLAVNKPAGLATQSPKSFPSLEAQVKTYLRETYHKPGRVYLGIPHRLDRPVSGVILFAKQSKSAQRLAGQFRERQVKKVYWAMLEGEVETETGIWEDWLRRVPDEPRVVQATTEEPQAKLARMSYRVMQVLEGKSFIQFIPETGRMHQIRVQAALRGWPVVGDDLYGAKSSFPVEDGIALHARSLTVLHPIRYEPMTIVAELPESWDAFSITDTFCE